MERFIDYFKIKKNKANYDVPKEINEIENIANGISIFLSSFEGCTIGNGIYSIFLLKDVVALTEIATNYFPGVKNDILCFGHDWLGRFFAIDKRRINRSQAEIILLDPAFSEGLEIPTNFNDLHDIEFIDSANDALAKAMYDSYILNAGTPSTYLKSVGYRVFPILGGKDEIENLEICDTEVYWELLKQIKEKIK